MKRPIKVRKSEFNTLVAEATLDLYRKKKKLSVRENRFKKALSSIYIKTMLFLLLICFAGWRIYGFIDKSGDAGKPDENDIGKGVAGTVNSLSRDGDKIVVVPMFGRDNPLYVRRIKAIRDSLTEKLSMNEYWTVDCGTYDPEDNPDISPSIEKALESFPDSRIVVVVSGGRLPNMKPSNEIKKFLASGGLFVFLGEVDRGSNLTEFISGTKSVLLARRTSLIMERGFKEYPQMPEGYFKENFVKISGS
jgi:hypothetical protein